VLPIKNYKFNRGVIIREGETPPYFKREMNTENIYQIIDDLEGFAQQIGSEWMKERLAMLEAHLAQLENNQSIK
jgi:hypothetical protein